MHTQSVEVRVPVTVPVPVELTQPVPVPALQGDTNADLAQLVLSLQAALSAANQKLRAIVGLAPDSSTK